MTKTCKTCERKYLCKNYGKVCDKYKKEPYTRLVKVEGDIKIIERMEEIKMNEVETWDEYLWNEMNQVGFMLGEEN